MKMYAQRPTHFALVQKHASLQEDERYNSTSYQVAAFELGGLVIQRSRIAICDLRMERDASLSQ